MNAVALVMAGGRGTRMKGGGEKPLVRFLGISMIERIVATLKGASRVGRIIVAVTKDTPKTAAKAKKLDVEVLETPGEGYIKDMKYAIRSLELGLTLVVSADLPLLKSKIIDNTITYFELCGKPALALVASLEGYVKLGLKPDYRFDLDGRPVTPVGVNIIEGTKIDEPQLNQENLLIKEVEYVINVNTTDDLIAAEQILLRHMKGLRVDGVDHHV